MKRALVLLSAATFAVASFAATPVATYTFNGTLAAQEAGVPSLTAINPLGTNGFETAVVNGVSRTVYRWDGDGSSPELNAGLQLDASGLVQYDNYSVEIVFEFTELPAFGNGWRRILDTQNRRSDNGFYVDPSSHLEVYPVVSGSTTFTTSQFHSVVLTNFVVGGVREVKAYLDGELQLTSDTDQLNLDNDNNPGHLLTFFADNLESSAQLEFANGRIAYLRLYDGILTSVPEPSAWMLLAAGLGLVLRRSRKAQRAMR